MKKTIFSIIITVYILFMAGCAGRNAASAGEKEHVHTEACSHDHSHDGHDHDGHSHEGHNHDGHDHDSHSHEGHDHAAHDHAGHGPDCSHGASGVQEELTDEIIFPAAQAARVDFRVEETALSTFREVIRASGDILAAQGDAQTVIAPIAGVMSFPQARIASGMHVAKGEVLFYVSSRNVAGGDTAVKARAAYESAKAAYERAEKLLPDNIVSQREYEEARREYLNAKSEWEALSAGSTDKGSAVRAPSAGYVTALTVSEGEFAEVGQALAVVSQNSRQQLVARVPGRYYMQLPGIRSANIVASDGEVVNLAGRNGRLISVGRSLDAGSTLVPVTFEFDAHPAVIPGSVVDVYLLGAEREGVLAVPVGAVTESQGDYFVYEQVDEEGYVRHEVKIGSSDGQRIEILSGLEPGRRIVTRGAVHVKMATASAIPHSHEH